MVEAEIIWTLNKVLHSELFAHSDFKAYIAEKARRIHLSEIRRNEVEHTAQHLLEEGSHFKKGKKLEELKPFRGLVDGVFDMTHFGHFNAFRQASKLCDDLVVAINSSEEVFKHKGWPNQLEAVVFG